jgi:hypothetical protein
MNKQLKTLKYLLAGALLFAVATTRAQTPADSTMHHRPGMRHWGNRNGGDSTKSFHRGPDGWAHRGNGKDNGFNGDGGHGHFAHRGFGGEHLRYTPDQRKQLMAINKDFRQKRADLYKQDNLTLKQYKAGLLALDKEKKGKMQALLTPEQQNQVAAGHKRMDENRQVREAAHLERLKLHLNLTDDQVAKIKAGNTNLHSQVKAIHENDNLLPEQKREQMKALMAKRNDTYKSVLTADQYTQFEQMMSHRRAGGSQFRGSRSI